MLRRSYSLRRTYRQNILSCARLFDVASSLPDACRASHHVHGHTVWHSSVLYGPQKSRMHRYFACTSVKRRQTEAAVGSQHITPQSPPRNILSVLPMSWVPYAELVRLDKPVGTYYLFFPCLFSTLMAAPLHDPVIPPLTVAATSALFLGGALIMRGAGCTINDLWDRNHDPHVERTRLRPIARGAISPTNAIIFTGAQLMAGLAVLLQFPFECFWYAVPSLPIVFMYPLAKRVTNYPQAVLGLAFSWGAFMGFPALGVDLLSNSAALTGAALLYGSNVAWTVLYDMIYAHMDLKDDKIAGIKSIALRYEHNTKSVLACLAATQTASLIAAGYAVGAGPLFYLISCCGGGLTTSTMIWSVRLNDAQNCWWWFRNGCWLTGGSIALGLAGDYYMRLPSERTASSSKRLADGNLLDGPSRTEPPHE